MNTKSFKELKITQKPVTHAGSPCPLVQWSYNSQELDEKREGKNLQKLGKQNGFGGGVKSQDSQDRGADEGSGIKDQKMRKE